MKDAEKSLGGNTESYSSFKNRLEKLPDNVVVIGSHTQTDNRKEKVMLVLCPWLSDHCWKQKVLLIFTLHVLLCYAVI